MFILVCVDVLAGFPSLPPPEEETPWWVLAPLIVTTILLMIGLRRYYVAYLAKDSRMSSEQKARWIARVKTYGPFAMLPLYIVEIIGRNSEAKTLR
jgi:hypothetical protein